MSEPRTDVELNQTEVSDKLEHDQILEATQQQVICCHLLSHFVSASSAWTLPLTQWQLIMHSCLIHLCLVLVDVSSSGC